jgi:CRISPR system Cascade subunit CasB
MPKPGDRETQFVAHLQRLQEREDRGALAALRRGLGKPPGGAPEMFPYVIPHTQGLSAWREDHFLLVAALFALHPVSTPEGNIGDTFADVRRRRGAAEAEDSLEKRFVALLNCHGDDLPNHLRHTVALARTAEVPVNWGRLLADLGAWDHPGRYVQRDWARSYWRPHTREARPEADAEPSNTTAQDA